MIVARFDHRIPEAVDMTSVPKKSIGVPGQGGIECPGQPSFCASITVEAPTEPLSDVAGRAAVAGEDLIMRTGKIDDHICL